MSTLYSIGNMNQLADALENAGFTPDDVTKLRSYGDLARMKDVLRGHASIVTSNHVVDLDADPFVPDGWSVEEHQRGGSFEWNPEKASLFLTEEQSNGSYNRGDDLRKKLEGMNPFNANLLDYLLKHPDLIPDEWKGKWVFFWGTIYRFSSGFLFVRCLRWFGDEWHWRYFWLDDDFDDDCPSAVPART